MAWNDAVVTNAGVALLRQVLSGETLTLDGAAGGTGTVSPASLMAQTALKDKKQTFSIVGMTNVDNGKKINIQVTNLDLEAGYALNQVGIWAHVGTGASVLYAILQDPIGITIPSKTQMQDFAMNVYAVVDFSNNATVDLTIDATALVTRATLNEELKKKASTVDLGSLAFKSVAEKTDLSENVRTSLDNADEALEIAVTAQQAADNAASAAATAQQTAEQALQKAEDNAGGCVLQITFDSAFSGKTYTVTGPDESYTGTVPTGLYVEVSVKNCNTTYTFNSTDTSDTAYSAAVTTGDYFGQYPVQLTTFSATLNVTTSAGATVTATSGGNTYSGTADSGGIASLTIRHSGTYEVTSALNGETVSGSIAITTSGGTYSLTLAFISTTLNKNTWAKIKEVSDAGTGANYWNVGDTKTIAINGTVGNTTFSNLSIDVFILGFNHNSSREGSNRIHFQIGKISGTPVTLVDSNYGSSGSSAANFQMNASNTNSGGWNASSMRKTLLGNNGTPTNPPSGSLLAALPSDLRAVMKPCTKYSDNTGGGSDTASYVTSTTDYLFLLSEFEYHGTRTYANSAEQNYQAQYSYYQAGNSKIKYKHNATGTAVYVWCRSVNASNSNVFCLVGADGGAGNGATINSRGVAPGFCA